MHISGMNMNDNYTLDKTARRYSYFAPFYYGTEFFQRRLGNFNSTNLNNSMFTENKDTSFEVLHQESLKIKEFIQRVFTNESNKNSRRHSYTIERNSGLNKKKSARFTNLSTKSLVLDTVRAQLVSKFTQEERKGPEIKHKSPKDKVNLKATFNSLSVLEMLEKTRKLQRMNKIKDSEHSDDGLIDVGDDNTSWVIMPESWFLNIWEIIIFLSLLYIFLFDAYMIGFIEDMSETIVTLSIVIDFIFFIDFIFNFFKAYYDSNEELVTNRKKVILNYLENGFMIDLASSIPFSTLFSFMDSTDSDINYKLIRIAKVTRFSRLTRALKFTKLIKAFKGEHIQIKFLEDVNIGSNAKLFVKFFVYFLLFNHVSTCIWVFISRLDYPNWVSQLGLQDESNLDLYINGLYFNLTTVFTIGYGDIHSVNMYERLYNNVLMIVGVLVYSFAISSLSNIVVKQDKKEKIYRKRMELLDEVKLNHGLDNDLHKLLSRFLFYDLQINRVNKMNILDELPFQLRYNLINQIYKCPIQNLKFFKNAPRDFISRAVILLRQIKLYKNEFVIKTGHYLDEMYFVKSGKLTVRLNINKYKRLKLLHIFPNEHFGEIYMCKRVRCPLEVKVGSKTCELYCLSRMDFIELNEEFPKLIQSHIKKALANATKIELIAKDMLTRMDKTYIDKVKPTRTPSMANARADFITMINIKPNKDHNADGYNYNSDDNLRIKKYNLGTGNLIVPRKCASSKSSPFKKNKIPLEENTQHHLQLINFNTKDIQNLAIMEKSESSGYSDSSHTKSSHSVDSSKVGSVLGSISSRTNSSKANSSRMISSKINSSRVNSSRVNSSNTNLNLGNSAAEKRRHTNPTNNVVLNINNTITPQEVGNAGGAINISYNINIQNNLNINNYIDKVLDNQKVSINSSDKEIKAASPKERTMKEIIFASPKVTPKPEPARRSILNLSPSRNSPRKSTQKKTIIRQNNIIDESTNPMNESLNEDIKDAYEKNTTEIQKLTSVPLFGFIKNFQPRRSEQTGSIGGRFYATQALNKNKGKQFPKQISSIPTPDKRSSSIADIKRLSEHHFMDIVEKMRRDALFKKNPSYLSSPAKSINGGQGKMIEQQIDRITEFFESMLISIAKKKGHYHE
jgi:hypothetical protein